MRNFLAVGLLLLGACGIAVPMHGETHDGERFIGVLMNRGRDYGPLELRNDRGVTCEGTWVFSSSASGSATFTCSDGRSGSVEFASTGAAGTLKGMLDGKPFSGTFQRLPPDGRMR